MNRSLLSLLAMLAIGVLQAADKPPKIAEKWVDPRTLGLLPMLPGAEPVAANWFSMSRYSPVFARKDPITAEGSWNPDAWSFALKDHKWGEPGQLSIVAFPDEPVDYRHSRGMAVRVINRTGVEKSLAAVNSYLHIVQEVLTESNQWEPIEHIFQGGCGLTPREPVTVQPGHYCEMAGPSFQGPLKVRMRLSLQNFVRDGAEVRAVYTYSNTFWGSIHGHQLNHQSMESHLRKAELRKPPPSEE